ncbi:D-isomer specific 2-hydroxyacid dehydrogenase [Trypanosoma melophagium]|uniref:D-isomer specific 2-hydroxyacid dehydrogenase n=3 Tax=Trypanosoma melophagium TaxID=715481 RepID=UPI003519F425|nr:D-isomer specific 2-hydroxyacid dehydrogenase [Trypanosoma melophagium]KAH9577378.1 D-isomer specific 2-hydroxyacid dehydrogenase [Trypanosoma melophagium]KAH9577392.1 D-isomer specific 2-hydroxyacid dehydrogenase [Trypanosoma melophagium]KAH9577410.1 D-isomer specific 2-hydroxyacid dehydrogenase [Trypanosoma melophagium]KAH9577423.1 D-isomer specific 2-hydroxyacid dehydrogenase [Trypanosoma melophagium]
MTFRLCVATATANNVEYYKSAFSKHLSHLAKSITLGSAPLDFQEAKNSGDAIILFVEGAVGHDAIKDLCDDYNLPKERRRVRWVYSLTAGVDVYRLGLLTKELKDIPFANGHGCYSPILAEHVIYSMLYFNRQTWRLLASRAEHKWDPFNMIELRGQKMGIIGYGDIGHATAKLAVTMGMEVTGVKRSAPTANVDEYGVHVVHGDAARDRVLRESDFVVNILPGTEETREFFNKERFALMKPSAIYINIGRGLTQNEEHLACALRDGVIAGAAVDVFTKEPFPPESPLWNIGDDKLLLSAHSADRTADLVPSSVRRFIGLVEKYVETGKLDTYLVDLARGY